MTARQTSADVVVVGDCTLDWHLYNVANGRGWVDVSAASGGTRHCYHAAGAAMLAELCQAIGGRLSRGRGGPFTVSGPSGRPLPVAAADPAVHRSYSQWGRFPNSGEEPGHAWRVDRTLGLGPVPAADVAASAYRSDAARLKASGAAKVVLIEDRAIGVRRHPELADVIPAEAWTVLRTTHPVEASPLIEAVLRRPERLVVLIAVHDLRRTAALISRGRSWEQTVSDVLREFAFNPLLNRIGMARHVVVSFGATAALLMSSPPHGGNGVRTTRALRLDPKAIEGEWEQRHPGIMFGYMACMAAAIVPELLRSNDALSLSDPVAHGLSAVRAIHCAGFRHRTGEGEGLEFPYDLAADTIVAGDAGVFAEAPVPAGPPSNWSIVDDLISSDPDAALESVARHGLDTGLLGIPSATFGRFTTVDIREIEGLRVIAELMSEYRDSAQSRPLSIGVFGPPGSGKSFGVEEVARAIGGKDVRSLKFNLSQFESPSDIASALHRVRDAALSGIPPVVFWDEFDTPFQGKLGWLRYFLAPMQDGEFQQGEIVHPVGRCIFVFAGGTCHSSREFIDLSRDDQYRDQKVRDFASRLKGTLDVQGPDQVAPDDRHFRIRRAILFRSLVGKHHPALMSNGDLRVDDGVLRAFLGIDSYRHGVRSMESIILMSRLAGRDAYERSALPPRDQLCLHVDGAQFMDLVHRIVLSPSVEQSICDGAAQAITEFRAATAAAAAKRSTVPTRYLAMARDLPNTLRSAGYAMRHVGDRAAAHSLSEQAVETIAIREHERAVAVARREEARHSANDQGLPVHDRPPRPGWAELSASKKELNRQLVRLLPAVLAKAGYELHPLEAR